MRGSHPRPDLHDLRLLPRRNALEAHAGGYLPPAALDGLVSKLQGYAEGLAGSHLEPQVQGRSTTAGPNSAQPELGPADRHAQVTEVARWS